MTDGTDYEAAVSWLDDIQRQASQAREAALEGLYAVRMAATGTVSPDDPATFGKAEERLLKSIDGLTALATNADGIAVALDGKGAQR